MTNPGHRYILGVLCVSLAALLGGCDTKTAPPTPKPPTKVTVTTVVTKDVPIRVRAVGTLRANQIADISAQIAGNLTALKFEDGMTVKTGDPIALLDSDVQQSAYDAAVAAMETAKYTYENTKQLLAAEASTKFEVEQNLNAYNQAQAEVAERKSALDKLTLKAPFDGRLAIHMRDVGDYLNEGDAIVTLVNGDPMLVDYRVPEKYVEKLAVGQAVTIAPTGIPLFVAGSSETGVGDEKLPGASRAVPGPDSVTGKVTAIDPRIDLSTRTVLVRALVSNPDGKLTSGRFVHVEQTIGTLAGAQLVPQQAIVLDTNGAAVFVVGNDQTVKRAPVQLGEYLGTDVMVNEGLKEGDRVVTRGWQKLHTGAKVEVDDDGGSAKPQTSEGGAR